jgi:hypothetical protein
VWKGRNKEVNNRVKERRGKEQENSVERQK